MFPILVAALGLQKRVFNNCQQSVATYAWLSIIPKPLTLLWPDYFGWKFPVFLCNSSISKTTEMTFGAPLVILVRRLNPRQFKLALPETQGLSEPFKCRETQNLCIWISIQNHRFIIYLSFRYRTQMRSHWSKVSFQTHEVIVSTMLWGFVIVIKRNGTDGSTFPMVNEVKREGAKKVLCEKWFSQECLLGRGEGCDIRIQLPVVSKEHARIKVQAVDQKVYLPLNTILSQILWLKMPQSTLKKITQVYITALSKTNATKLNDDVLENEVTS